VTTHSNTLRFTRALLAANLKSTVMLRGAFVMQVAFMALNNLTFFVFWWALMRRVPMLRGWRLGDIQVLFGIVAAGFGLAVTFAGGVRHLGRFIDEGELDTLLTQPRPVLLYALGLRSQASGVGDMLSGMAFIGWSGAFSWRALPMVAFGIGQGLGLSSLTTAGMAGVGADDAGVAGGLVNVAHHIGGALGLGILVTVFAAAGAGAHSARELLAQRVSASLTGAALMLALALLVTVVARPHTAAAEAICDRAAVV